MTKHIYVDDFSRIISGVVVERGYSTHGCDENGQSLGKSEYVKTYELDETDPSNAETLTRLINEGWRNIDGRYEKVVDAPSLWRLHRNELGGLENECH